MVYVDGVTEYPTAMVKQAARRHGTRWSHLYSDDLEELHLFAKGIGLRRRWYQGGRIPHYDVTPFMRNLAILRGAKVKPLREYLMEKGRSDE